MVRAIILYLAQSVVRYFIFLVVMLLGLSFCFYGYFASNMHKQYQLMHDRVLILQKSSDQWQTKIQLISQKIADIKQRQIYKKEHSVDAIINDLALDQYHLKIKLVEKKPRLRSFRLCVEGKFEDIIKFLSSESLVQLCMLKAFLIQKNSNNCQLLLFINLEIG